ncbi:MAG: alanine racemase [Acidimicrobiales bacterium]|nr:alanine racemase [Acidimicrobiales bacterium]
MRPVRADIDLGAVAHNIATMRAIAAPSLLCAVVKADGYGHGAVPVARAAVEAGADVLAVALVAEGAELRDAGIRVPVIVLSQASPDELHDLVAYDLEATVDTSDGVAALAAAAIERARPAGRPLRVHLKVDTGMHRVGAQPDEVVRLAKELSAAPGLALASVWTHCAVADEPGDPFTSTQLDRYEAVLADLAAAGIEPALRHAANSATTLDHPRGRYDLVRCGIVVYGLAPSPALADRADLRPALSLVAQVSHVKRLPAGERLSYGRHYTCATDTTIATVPLGYADGVPRNLAAAGGEVLVGGRRRSIAGTVTMDQLMVDCGDDPVAVGDEVVLIGSQGSAEVTAAEWADLLGTISYEIVCGIGARVPRRYVQDEGISR